MDGCMENGETAMGRKMLCHVVTFYVFSMLYIMWNRGFGAVGGPALV